MLTIEASQIPFILRLPETSRRTGLSRSSIYRLEALGQFPSRVKISECASGWRSDEIQAWIESRPRAVIQKELAK